MLTTWSFGLARSATHLASCTIPFIQRFFAIASVDPEIGVSRKTLLRQYLLRQEERTVEVFKWLSKASEEDARKMYGISKAALIKHHEYELCGKYVDAEADVERIGESYALGLTMKNRFGKAHHDFVEKKFVNDSATLVAILVKTGRAGEAKEAAKKLKGVVTDAKLSKKLKRELDAALDGTVPAPWP